MFAVLGIAALLVLLSFWRAHRNSMSQFNAFDLIMEDGKVSKIAFSYMLVLAVSTWVIVLMAWRDKLTDGMFGLWLGAWVAPLVTKLVFNKNEMPGSVTSTMTVQQTTEVTKP
jgi:hypothetical protein